VSRDTGGVLGREVVSGFPPKSYYTRTCGGGQRLLWAEKERERDRKRDGGGEGLGKEDDISSINNPGHS